jgi:hypothetical protein
MSLAASAHFCSTSALNSFQASGLEAFAAPAKASPASVAVASRIADFMLKPPLSFPLPSAPMSR